MVSAILLLILSGCGVGDGAETLPSVARVDGEAIGVEEFRTRYVGYLLATGLQDNPRHRTHLLHTLVAERLLVREAREAGVEDRAGYAAAAERIREKLLIELYVQRALYDTLQISEEDLQAMFVRANTTVEARHLYARTLDEALALRRRLDGGASFEELAREVFADSALAHSGGSVGAFSIDELDPSFEEAAYTLPIGAISDPVRTQTGYSIIRVEDRFTKPLLTEFEFATRRDRMEHYVTYRRKTAARAQHARDLAAALVPVYDEAQLARLLRQIVGPPVPDTQEEAWLQAELVASGAPDERQSWSVVRFREAAASTSEAQRAAVTDRETLMAFIEGLLVREAMLGAAAERRLEEEEAYARAFEAAMRDWIREEVMRDLAREAPVLEDSVRAYFATFGQEFSEPARVRVSEILLDSPVEAARMRDLATPATFAELARAHSIRPGAVATGGDMGYVAADQLGVLADPVFGALAGTLLGPIEVRGHYVLLLVGDRQEARPMAFEAARPLIEERLRSGSMDRVLRARIEQLRSESNVEIDEATLTQMAIKKTHV
ncbi:MAG: peptidylprolyl isomerase [Rhodothermales bacterium]|nr:peptidylprolyl isomerase [Rhodothermales bacterium]